MPLYSAASTVSTPIEIPLMKRFAKGEVLRRGERVQGKFGDQGAAQGQHLLRDPAVFLGINNVHAGAENRDRLPLGVNGAAMRGSVNARAKPLKIARPRCARSQAIRPAIPSLLGVG